MTSCAACNSTIFLGGIREGDARYCNGRCRQAGPLSRLSESIDAASVARQAQQLREGPCGVCGRKGRPVDRRTSHRATSLVLVTHWRSYPELSCRPCHRKALAKNSALTLLLGWWGFPWGLLATPLQVLRNLVAAVVGRETLTPSSALLAHARMQLAAQKLSSATCEVPPLNAPPNAG